MLKRLILGLVLLLLTIFLPRPVLAEGEFATNYIVSYQVASSGITHATFNISLSNKMSNVYATEFGLSIGSTNLSNVKVYNSKGELPATVNQGEKTTSLNITFPDKVLGKDQAQVFTLEFDSTDFAHLSGVVWDLTIPKLADAGGLESYQLTLSVPSAFGEPTTLSPKPITQSLSGGFTTFRFNPIDLVEKGLSATFGQNQWFDFSLNYNLNNPNVFPVRTEIALPPDTDLQQVAYQTLTPAPENISVDADGNWLASYLLNPRQNLTVFATGSAQIYLTPRTDVPDFFGNLSDYLKPAQFWESDSAKIIELSKTLTSPQQIYQYVVDNLIYDYGRLSGDSTTRFGAANALDKADSAVCMEFTDLFIAIARAAGIPARAVNGYAYTTNAALRPLSLEKDVLHAWPEYYEDSSNRWIPVDPTWGNTTGGVDYFSQFDLNHFTFVRQGLDSSYPIPAGAYKLSGNDSKDVSVEFGRSILPQERIAISFNLPTSAIAGVAIKGEVVVTNTGTVALYDLPINVTSSHFSIKNAQFTVPNLPPFSHIAIPIELPATGWMDNLTDTVTASSGNYSAAHKITLTPAYSLATQPKNLIYPLGTLTLLGAALVGLRLLKRLKLKQ